MVEIFINADLVLKSGLHIGSGKSSGPTDAPVRRSVNGRLLIPGRAIAGSFRTTATRLAPRIFGDEGVCQALLKSKEQKQKETCNCIVCRLFGDVHPLEKPPEHEGDWIPAHPSQLWVYDAFANADSDTFVRDGVGIQRQTGHAAENVKFDYEVVPRNTQFKLSMRLAYRLDEEVDEKETTPIHDAATEKKVQQLLVATLAEWEAGRGQLGGNVSRGLGRFKLDNLTYTEPKLKSADDLINYLKAANVETVRKPVSGWPDELMDEVRGNVQGRGRNGRSQSITSTFLTIKFDLTFKDLFLQHDPLTAFLSGFDHAPMIEQFSKDGLGNPLLSGSSLRGVLRSHAEKIIRTLFTNYCIENEQEMAADRRFKENCPACDPHVRDIKKPLTSCYHRLKEQNDAHHEWQEGDFCLTCQLFGNQERGSRLWVQDAHWHENKAVKWQGQDFLAIDRFTGGGLEGAKFDAAPLVGAVFQTAVTLHDPAAWELGLLTLLLRDLADGRLTIGFGAAKGYGRCHANNI
ncbi:MAG: hypothetical protein GY805_13720, partial [Chloroflexi bacterium]|nr:hypothetical protein [Chloroflexota bacterium]